MTTSGTFKFHILRYIWALLGLWIAAHLLAIPFEEKSEKSENMSMTPHERHKRFIYMDNNRQFMLPKGAAFAVSTIIQLPFLGTLPIGYGSGLTLAVPFSVKFDDLNMTSPDNRFGYFDGLGLGPLAQAFATRMGLPTIGFDLLGTYIGRRKRDTDTNSLSKHPFGDRQAIYEVIESFSKLVNFDTKQCLLRAICEWHKGPVADYEFVGEVIDSLLSPSMSPFANERMNEHVKAEMTGKLHGNCTSYENVCPHTIFKSTLKPSGQSKHRQKRFVMFGPGRQILFPPATLILFTPAFNVPFFRDLPKGYTSQLSFSFPFTMDFDVIGLTSSLNNFGNALFLKRRRRRDINNRLPDINYAGGDRVIMYKAIENGIQNIGVDGKSCLLRTICEMNEEPPSDSGFGGQIAQIFLTPSRSKFAHTRLREYVTAELLGRSCGDCSDYFQGCKISIFSAPTSNKRFRNPRDLEKCKKKFRIKERRPLIGENITNFSESLYVQRRNFSNNKYFPVNTVSDLTMPSMMRIRG